MEWNTYGLLHKSSYYWLSKLCAVLQWLLLQCKHIQQQWHARTPNHIFRHFVQSLISSSLIFFFFRFPVNRTCTHQPISWIIGLFVSRLLSLCFYNKNIASLPDGPSWLIWSAYCTKALSDYYLLITQCTSVATLTICKELITKLRSKLHIADTQRGWFMFIVTRTLY